MSKNNKKRALILGGSSDIGQEVVKYFQKKLVSYSPLFWKNKKFLKTFKNLKIDFIKCDLMKTKNLKPFLKKYDTVINLV